MKVVFDDNATAEASIQGQVKDFLKDVETLENTKGFPIIIYEDRKSNAYYIRCCIQAEVACPLLDTSARLDPTQAESFRANRELLLEHNTYKRMVSDAKEGREFSDIIVEYSREYSPEKPLKIWGGQHRAKAIQCSYDESEVSRYHGFRIFFNLSKKQRTEIALISNTNIAVSNDLFDRLQEETLVGLKLRTWCYEIGLLKKGDDFPDRGSGSEKITVKLARTFIVNFYKGKKKGGDVSDKGLDQHVYEPYLCESGANLDAEYEKIINVYGKSIWSDKPLKEAGKAFTLLHKAQYDAVKNSKTISNRKPFRNKAMTESVLSAWAFVAGLLQTNSERFQNHFSLPPRSKAIPDPLNASDMSTFRHDSDDPTYRGLGTRSAIKDRQRMAQLFLARSLENAKAIDKKLMEGAVSQVVGLKALQKGYTP